MELKDFVTRLQPEEHASYSALVAEAEGSPVSNAALRRKLARLIIRVQERSGEDPNPGPLIRAFLRQHLPRIPAAGDVPLQELVQQFPYPLALKLNMLLSDHRRQVAGEGLPRFPYDVCVTMGLLVRLTAVIGIQSYVRIAGATDAALNRKVLETLRAASDGAWRELAIDLVTAVEKRPDAPLARKTRAALARRVPVPGVPHVAAALQELVRYRNRLIHGVRVPPGETARAMELLTAAVRAFGFLVEYELVVRRAGRTFRLSGVLPVEINREMPDLPEDEPCLVHRALIEPPLSLAPLLVFREGTPHGVVDFDELFFLNAGAVERLSYIAYRYARHLDGRELGVYEAFRRFMRSIPAPRIPPDPRIDFTSLVEEHEALFVGREDVLAEIETFVATRPAPYGIVKARGGMGKTAVFSRLYARHGVPTAHVVPQGNRWVFHFCMRQGERDSAVVALRSLIAQICDVFALERRSYLSNDREALEKSLERLFQEAGDRLAAGEYLVLVIDALDEGMSESSGEGVPRVLPARVPDHVIVVVSYRVDEENQNTRVERQLAHIPTGGRRVLASADPMGGLTRDNVASYLNLLMPRGDVPEAALQAVWKAAAQETDTADPFYLRFVAGGVAEGHIDLARPETVPASLDEAFDELWVRLPPDRDFLVHRILGLLAIMGDYGDDELFASLLNRSLPDETEPLTPLEVASLRAQAGKLLIYDGDRYCLVHDRFRHYLVGDSSAADHDHAITASPS